MFGLLRLIRFRVFTRALVGTVILFHFNSSHSLAAGDEYKPRTQFCREYLGDDVPPTLRAYTVPRPGFKPSQNEYRYKGVIGQGLRIRSQNRLGSCWIQEELNRLELRALKNTGKDLRLSADYLIAMNLFLMTLEAIDGPSRQMVEGGSPKRAAKIIHDYGLVTEDAWHWQMPLQDSDVVMRRLMFHLRVLVDSARGRLLPSAIRMDADKAAQLKSEIHQEILALIESFTGPLPKSFVHEGKEWNPVAFSRDQHYFAPPESSQNLRPLVALARVPHSPRVLFDAVKKQLDSIMEPAAVVFLWEDIFIDNAITGIASIAAFSHYILTDHSRPREDLYKILSEHAADVGQPRSGHAMLIVDYEVDEHGNPVRVLALNSHGEGSGDRGFVHLYWDYFQTFVSSVSVYENFAP